LSGDNFPKLEIGYEEYDVVKIPAHATILQNFTDSILHGAELIAPGYDGINQLTLTNAAYLSAWKGKTVSLPLDPAEYDEYLDKLIASSNTRDVTDSKTMSDGYSDRWQVNW
jgi:hypothetical protein